jgi:4-amino-4-deoxy-L-arabinose transferase-like glycosyltransferase
MIYRQRHMRQLQRNAAARSEGAVNRFAAWGRSAARWSAGHIPELVMLLVGVALRVSLHWSFDVHLGYDFPAHLQYAEYVEQHAWFPRYDLNFSTYNPPLFYALAALMLRAGFAAQTIGWISIASSCLQMILLLVGAEMYLRESRLARVLALATMAVLPVSVHVAGFFSNTALSDMFSTAAAVLLPQVFLRRGRSAVHYGIAAGACLGLALVTKVSALMVLVGFLIAVGATVARGGVREATRDLLRATAAVLVVTAALSGWHYVRHRVLYGQFVLTAYDPYLQTDLIFKTPYLDRRTFGFVGYWDATIYKSPYWPAASRPYTRFWPMLVASTFSDYYNFAFVARPSPGMAFTWINAKPFRIAAYLPSRLSVVGGTGLAFLMAAALLVGMRTLWRRQDYARLTLLLAALLAIAGQLHFAVRFRVDDAGPIKGGYLQFVGPIFCALTGLAIAWLWSRRNPITYALAIAAMGAIGLVAVYTIYARVVVPIAG